MPPVACRRLREHADPPPRGRCTPSTAPKRRGRCPVTLHRSADRKVTNLPSPNGRTAKIANSFGLPAGRDYTCPGATATCERVCYAGRLEKLYKGLRQVLESNMAALAGQERTVPDFSDAGLGCQLIDVSIS